MSCSGKGGSQGLLSSNEPIPETSALPPHPPAPSFYLFLVLSHFMAINDIGLLDLFAF